MNLPRLMVAGTGGDSGKTLVTLGLAESWRREGRRVICFKKGPDYIDPAWLTIASGNPARNLDMWMMGSEQVTRSFQKQATAEGINLIEANRGLHDGSDASGSNSSALLARLLDVPVILVLPVVKVTRTAAAIVQGIMSLDPEVNIAGVVLNFVSGSRHETVVRRSIEEITGLRVLGALPKLKNDFLPGRHMGLITPQEHDEARSAITRSADLIRDYVDLPSLEKIAYDCDSIRIIGEAAPESTPDGKDLKIAHFVGSAFTFYYPENLEKLEDCGVELLRVNPLEDDCLPECDALYIGGGFPETHVARLTENRKFMKSVAEAAERGLPVWAECGGLMFLADGVQWCGERYRMAGVIPVEIQVYDDPQGHGYETVTIDKSNPFFDTGTVIRGHEFHYSQIVRGDHIDTIFKVTRGVGTGGGRDGIKYKNVIGTFLHVNANASPEWVWGMVNAARNYNKIENSEKAILEHAEPESEKAVGHQHDFSSVRET